MQSGKLTRWARTGGRVCALAVVAMLVGCSHVANQFVEDGPSVTMSWDSPSAVDARERFEAAGPIKNRKWDNVELAAADGSVMHWPLWFENPFVDKGHGRELQGDGRNVYHLGWEDYVAMPYGYGRLLVNFGFVPISAVVTPPWTLMESDGELSEQCLGYDHDAERAGDLPPNSLLKP